MMVKWRYFEQISTVLFFKGDEDKDVKYFDNRSVVAQNYKFKQHWAYVRTTTKNNALIHKQIIELWEAERMTK